MVPGVQGSRVSEFQSFRVSDQVLKGHPTVARHFNGGKTEATRSKPVPKGRLTSFFFLPTTKAVGSWYVTKIGTDGFSRRSITISFPVFFNRTFGTGFVGVAPSKPANELAGYCR